MPDDQIVREHLLKLLRHSEAHTDLDNLLVDFPISGINEKVEGLPYTAWQVLEHLRIAQWDILQFSIDANHVSPKFPQGYWPATDSVADVVRWNNTLEEFRADLKKMGELVSD